MIESDKKMPRYLFNVHEGVSAPDREGTELPDDDAARQESLAFAGKKLSDEASRLKLGDELQIEVADSAGMALLRGGGDLRAELRQVEEGVWRPASRSGSTDKASGA